MKLTREDHQNINKWITATGIMIEGGVRTPWTPSEEATLDKLDQMKKEAKPHLVELETLIMHIQPIMDEEMQADEGLQGAIFSLVRDAWKATEEATG